MTFLFEILFAVAVAAAVAAALYMAAPRDYSNDTNGAQYPVDEVTATGNCEPRTENR